MNSENRQSIDLSNVHGYDLTRQIYFYAPEDAIEFGETTDLDFKLRTYGPGPGEYFYSPPQWLLEVHDELTALRASVAELEAGR